MHKLGQINYQERVAKSDINLKPKDIKIKTLIFDLGGVIFTDGSMLAKKKIKDALHLSKDDIHLLEEYINKDGKIGNLIRLGLINLEELIEKFLLKIRYSKSKKKMIKHLWFSSYVPNYRMMKLVKNLSKNYRLVIFSGNVKERIEYLEKRYHFLKYFDETVFSFDYNINKQKLDFYYELLAHIDCKPEEAILIDDSWDNIRRAKKVGLNGVYFLYTKQLLKTLKKFGIKIKL